MWIPFVTLFFFFLVIKAQNGELFTLTRFFFLRMPSGGWIWCDHVRLSPALASPWISARHRSFLKLGGVLSDRSMHLRHHQHLIVVIKCIWVNQLCSKRVVDTAPAISPLHYYLELINRLSSSVWTSSLTAKKTRCSFDLEFQSDAREKQRAQKRALVVVAQHVHGHAPCTMVLKLAKKWEGLTPKRKEKKTQKEKKNLPRQEKPEPTGSKRHGVVRQGPFCLWFRGKVIHSTSSAHPDKQLFLEPQVCVTFSYVRYRPPNPVSFPSHQLVIMKSIT